MFSNFLKKKFKISTGPIIAYLKPTSWPIIWYQKKLELKKKFFPKSNRGYYKMDQISILKIGSGRSVGGCDDGIIARPNPAAGAERSEVVLT